jgi:hypothetical protein
MEKAQSALSNQDFSIWPKPSDNENASDVGWLFYSTRAQEEERLTQLFSKATGENIGVKWKPIRTTTGGIRKKDVNNPNDKIYALHIECATDRIHEVRKKLGTWYNSQSSYFLDGTKMRLVPTFASVLSANNKTKFASCLARHTAVAAGLATASTWEMSTNLLLDKKNPSTGKSFCDIMLALSPQENPNIPLFHTIDKQFKSANMFQFQFRPENAYDAHNIIAGLIPFLRDEGHKYFLKMFSSEALQ